MKKTWAALIGAVALAAFPAYFLVRRDFDFGGRAPLGTFERIDAWLMKDGEFTRTEIVPYHNTEPLSGWRAFEYVDGDRSHRTEVNNIVTVMLDPAGKVGAIATQFHSSSTRLWVSTSRTEYLTTELWMALAGEEPDFDDEMVHHHTSMQHLVGRFQAGGAWGTWRKIYSDGLKYRSIVDSCVFAKEPYSQFQESAYGGDKFPGKGAHGNRNRP